MYSKNLAIEKVQLALLDAGVVFVSALGATWLRHGAGVLAGGRETGSVPWSMYLFPSALVAVAFVALCRYQGLYGPPLGRWAEALRVVRAGTIATLAVVALTFFYRGNSYSRATVLLFYPLGILGVVAARNAYRVYRSAVMRNRAARRRVLIVGFGTTGRRLGAALLENPAFYELVGFLDDSPATAGTALEGVAVLGPTRELAATVRSHDVAEVILAAPSAPQERIVQWIGECLRLKVRWKVVPNLCDLMLERVHIDHVGGLPLVGLRGSRIVGFNWGLKRLFDVIVSAVLLLLLSPLLVLLAAAIRLSSSGPVLYRQSRLGLGGRPFTFLKFRTMRERNDPGLHQRFTTDWIYGRTGPGHALRSLGAAVGDRHRAVHKITKDPRVTRLGQWLRRTSLDELPQFWNVLRGEMSIVGPRPPLPYEAERYTEWHKRRLEVLPGITGLWQVSGRNRLSFDEMVRLDIRYIETWSLEEDVKIVLKTIPAMLTGRAY